MKKILAIALVALCAVGFAFANGASESTQNVSTDGSTSMEAVIGSLAEAFMIEHPEITVTYNPTGSGSGITAVQEGRCDIGLSSRALHDDEKAAGLTETVLALDGIAIIVNNSNPVTDLTLEQIADIYTGKITNWSEVGGNDGAIVLIGREDLCQYRQELTSTGDVITTVSTNPNAIGYASLSAVSDSTKTLAVNGVLPSEETVLSGEYLVQRPFVMATKSGEALSGAAQMFYDYALSSEAAPIIAGAGAVPLN